MAMAWAMAAALGLAMAVAAAQNSDDSQLPAAPPVNSSVNAAPVKGSPVKERFLVNRFPDKPSLPPAFSIPLDALGFAAPNNNYLGTRNIFVSLDFLDEDRLLFTFHVPGLIHRDPKSGAESDERQIRAVVLKLPQGTGEAHADTRVEAEALWTVHDRVRYLWPLKNGHFLVRDRNNLLEGDATLRLKPILDFPGPLLWVELDPAQQFLVTNSDEPVATAQNPGTRAGRSSSPLSNSGQTSSPLAASATATATTDQDAQATQEDRPRLVVRILRRDSGQVMLVSRMRSAVHVPINSTGYLENLRGRGAEWMLNFNYFTGGSKMLGSVESACDPDNSFLSENEILIVGCNSEGANKLVAMTTEGRTLWISQAPETEVWPQLTVAPNGSRLAWTTLDTSRSVSAFAPMDSEDVKEQSVTVFDAATGDIALVSPLSPILDAGGNVAISPSGRRVALINAGAIQVFELPPAAMLAAPAR
jgi:hypothetical protein